MKAYTVMMTLLAAVGILSGTAFGDETTATYCNALDAGDVEAATKAASYLAPPYCYDLNPWHGVTFEKVVNGRVVEPRFPFSYQHMTHIKVGKLHERAGLAAMEAAATDELELVRMISDWANAQWGHMQPLPYASWDAHEILDRVEAGDAFWCTYKAALFVQACNSAGLTARMLGINRRHADAHTVSEVYLNQFRKWVLVDPWENCYYECDGMPMSAREFHTALVTENTDGIELVFGANGEGTEFWAKKTGNADSLPHANARVVLSEHPKKGLIEHYFDIRIVLRNDHTVYPQSKENISVDGAMIPYNARGGDWWGPQLHWTDEYTPPQITCPNTDDPDDFEWPLNEVRVDLAKISLPGEPVVIEARFETLTPCFDRYDLSVNKEPVTVDGEVYRWKLREGRNTLTVASVNTRGRWGFPSEFVLNYAPSAVDFSRRVDVSIANPGFEEADENDATKPSDWSPITSNQLGAGVFELDRGTKHSGKRSLKTRPAKDGDTGAEYAFIVRAKPFEVNPATDYRYSIWLRGDRDGLPVDICLLDATYKGQGTYVKRVTVGKKWRKYDLTCRLNNELTRAYTGFKVYGGTVWADDAAIEEVGNVGDVEIGR